jgi:hypothetical protein
MVIEKLKYTIVKLRHERFGQSSERSTVLEQLELQLSGLDADAVQAETAAQIAAEQPEAEQPKVEMRSFARRAPDHPPFTDGSSQHARKMSVARSGPNDTVAWSSRNTGGLNRAWRLG